MGKSVIRMVETAAGPNGVYQANHFYEVDDKVADQFCTPHNVLGTVSAFRQNVRKLDLETVHVEDEPSRDPDNKPVPATETADILPPGYTHPNGTRTPEQTAASSTTTPPK